MILKRIEVSPHKNAYLYNLSYNGQWVGKENLFYAKHLHFIINIF